MDYTKNARRSKNVEDLRVKPNDPDFHRQLIRLTEAISDIQYSESIYKHALQDTFCRRFAKRTSIPLFNLSSKLRSKRAPVNMFDGQEEATYSTISPASADACNGRFAASLETKALQLEKIKTALHQNFGNLRKDSDLLWKAISIDEYKCQIEEKEMIKAAKEKAQAPSISLPTPENSNKQGYEIPCYRALAIARDAVKEFILAFDSASNELGAKITSLRTMANGSLCPADQKK